MEMEEKKRMRERGMNRFGRGGGTLARPSSHLLSSSHQSYHYIESFSTHPFLGASPLPNKSQCQIREEGKKEQDGRGSDWFKRKKGDRE